MTKLKVSDDLRLPIDTVTQRISILGKTRSGKSHTAGVIVEEVLKAGQQTVILDPKGDWWGLRSSADGKSEGLPITIMGGKHGDVPLEPTAGALIADLVVGERVSLVLDLSLFDSKADEVRFVTAFLDRLYRKNSEPVLLVIDEGDVFAPQHPEKNETVMLNRMETICRRGAGRGIGVILISQRSAAIHKGCLSQTELMIAHQTTAPQDKDAIEEWVVDNDDQGRRKEFMSRITKLKKGTAIVWSPSWLEIYKEVQVRRKETFDSGDAPKVGKRRKAPKVLAPVDLERLRKHSAATLEKAKEEDPKLLRAEIARLKAELSRRPESRAPQIKTEKVVEKTVVREAVPVMKKALVTRMEQAIERCRQALDRAEKAGTPLKEASAALTRAVEEGRKMGEKLSENRIVHRTSVPQRAPAAAPRAPKAPAPPSPTSPPKVGDEKPLDKCERAILGVLANFPEGCPIGKIALLAKYRVSGGFRNSLSTLRTRGAILGSNDQVMKITVGGLADLGDVEPLPEGQALVDYWTTHRSFGACERKILSTVIHSPDGGMTMEEIAQATGYEMSGGFRNALSTLRTAGVIVGKNNERMRACDELREAALVA